MLDGATIRAYTDEYTNFQVSKNGVTRTLQIPYYLGGKKTPAEIKNYILSNSKCFNGSALKTESEIEAIMSQNLSNCGVDCSGLVYYALNEASNGAVRTYFERTYSKYSGLLSYAYGLGTGYLTSKTDGTTITKAGSIVPGCTIRFKAAQGSTTDHVLVVYGTYNIGGQYTIRYAHSSGGTGPHNGYITIGNLDADLDDDSQTWYDSEYNDSNMKNRYDYTILLNCIK